METPYHRIAGHSLNRLAAPQRWRLRFRDDALVLDLRVPAAQAIHTEHDLWRALTALSPQLITYLMSFMTLGISGVRQQTQLNILVRADRNLAWIHIGFLLAVAITPFSTALLAEFITYRLALVVYWFDVLLLGVALYAGGRYAIRAELVKPDTPHSRRCTHVSPISRPSLHPFPDGETL